MARIEHTRASGRHPIGWSTWVWPQHDDPRSSPQLMRGELHARFRVEVVDRVVCTNPGAPIS